ncbi:MAG: PHP domain-containing protein, partial [Bacteroidales bacterium]|nr:PHP domain-containing protein [Bacteroidales bacterium]
MGKADLHIHSHYSSDGEYDVKNIVEKCIQNNVCTFSVTDHDSVKANYEAQQLAEEKRLHFVSGIEIDCNFKGTDLHLLGYNIDFSREEYTALEKDIYEKTQNAFSEMVFKLEKTGIEVDPDKVLQEAKGSLPTGELIAEVLLTDPSNKNKLLDPYREGGSRSDMPYLNFYLDYFSQGKPAYVKIEYMNYQDAVALVRDTAGIPIVAHPGLNFKGKEELVGELLDEGACGLEVFNNYHNFEQIEYFANLVLQKDKLMTCGSDFHGKTKPVIEIGNYNFVDKYKNYL